MKSLILVTSPPACGKTFISRALAKALNHVVYLDKDTLIVLSKQIFAVAGEPTNRSSDFFEENIRDYEYEAVVDLALEALDYEDVVLINAPFTREIRDKKYMHGLKEQVAKKGAKLVVVWVKTDKETCKKRMFERNSDRDTWKLEHWDEYISGVNFKIPEELNDSYCADSLLVFDNNSEEKFAKSMKEITGILESDDIAEMEENEKITA